MSSRALALFALVVPFAAACAGTTPVSPQNTTPACQTNNTASIKFENRYSTTTVDVIWDGSKLVTVAPGQTSNAYDVVAGIPHTLLWRKTNSSEVACSFSTPNLVQCRNYTHWCPA